jgi:hypothetical protein
MAHDNPYESIGEMFIEQTGQIAPGSKSPSHSFNVSGATEVKRGLRYNKGKIDLTQLSPVVKWLDSLVFMYGQLKYDRNNFKYFKGTEEEAIQEFRESAARHQLAYDMGEFFDKESGLPHLTHVNWNNARILDIYYYGMTHMKDGKDLFHQPLRHELPPIPTKKEDV